jgi:hypothetical protein
MCNHSSRDSGFTTIALSAAVDCNSLLSLSFYLSLSLLLLLSPSFPLLRFLALSIKAGDPELVFS